MATRREITPLVAFIRNLLLQRKVKNPLRFEDGISPRTQPPPDLPPGVSHNLSANYYYTRDGRRDCMPPTAVYNSISQPQLEAGESAEKTEAKAPIKTPSAGFGYNWSNGGKNYQN